MSENKKSNIIDFHRRFLRDFLAWAKNHPEISSDEDKLEIAAERALFKWYDAKKKWLGELSPNEYFRAITVPKELISLLVGYIEEDKRIPEPLLDRMTELGEGVYPLCIDLFDPSNCDEIAPDVLRIVQAELIGLITEMRREHPYSSYINLLIAASGEGAPELEDAIITVFEEAEDTAHTADLLINAFPKATGYTKSLILDILTGYPDDEGKVKDLVLKEYTMGNMDGTSLAAYESKLLDERALPYLKEFLDDPGTDYSTYIDIRSVYEALTGEILPEKDFSQDEIYKLLHDYEGEENE